MSDRERNKRTAVEYLELAFNEGHPEEAVALYQGPTYTQHNPMAGDGAGPFIRFAKGFKAEFPESRIDIKRVIAEGDLVVVHLHAKNTPDDHGVAAIDIFRLENGRLIEHWDVAQPVPETSANTNTMF